MGRLTLKPIKHLDIFGFLMLMFVGFGWAKPVPVNMRNFKSPRLGMAVTALAGPVSNIILSLIFCILFYALPFTLYFSPVGLAVVKIVERIVILSVGLAIFNLIPIPPLDGSKILFSLLPDRAYYNVLRYERYGMILLVIVLISGVLDKQLLYIMNSVLYGLEQIAQAVVNLFH
jgi:Zn-dependent protease